jgi:hypothetical protein
MAIMARKQQELTAEEKQAVRKFFIEHPELGEGAETTPTEQLIHNANVIEDYIRRWNVLIDAESLQKAYEALRAVNGVLQITSEARMKFAEATRCYTQAHQDILDAFLQRVHLVHNPNDDRTFENCTAIYRAMAGREWAHDNLMLVVQYLQGRGGRGTKLHWEQRKDPDAPEYRGHRFDRNDPNSYRFMPKSETNRSSLPSHSGNKYLNGEAEREKREAERQRFAKQPDDVVAAQHLMWRQMLDRAIAEGRTHSERNRIEQAARQSPGGIRQQAEAAHREAALLRQDRDRGR